MVSMGRVCKLPTIERRAGASAPRTCPGLRPASRAAVLDARACSGRGRNEWRGRSNTLLKRTHTITFHGCSVGFAITDRL